MSAHRTSRPRAAGAKRTAERGGFTLLSVLIAAAILIVGVLTVARSNTAIMAAQTDAGLSTKALEIARGYLEEIRARNPQTLATEPAVTIDDEGKPAVDGGFVRSMTVVSERENLLRVTVSVKGSRADQPVELVTFIYKGVHDD